MDITDIGKKILQGILDFFKTSGIIEVENKDNRLRFNISVSEAGFLIGKEGENLRALQYIFPLMVSRQAGQNIPLGNLVVDVNNYQQEKESYLEALAKNTAQRVLDTNRSEELSPMSPMERRIVHMAIESILGVKSESVGEGENRRVIIKPENNAMPIYE